MPDFVWKQGDTGPALVDTLSFPLGLPGASVSLRLRSLLNAAVITTTGPTKVVAENQVQFTPSAQDTSNAPGNYIAEWVVTKGGATQTFPTDGYLWGRIEPNASTAPKLLVDVPTIKEHLGLPSDDSRFDTRLANLVQVVTPLIEDAVGPVVPRLWEEWHDGGSDVIELARHPAWGYGNSPLMQLVAVSEYRGPVEFPLALVASPALGSIYSAFLNPELGTVTRRAPGGTTMPFFPGHDTVHIVYQAGQSVTPPHIAYAAKEAVRVAYFWPQQTGDGSRALADGYETGTPDMLGHLTRLIRTMLTNSRRAPSFA